MKRTIPGTSEFQKKHTVGRIILPFGILTFIVVVGTLFYFYFEGWGLLDAVYMTITTITTVGYKEVHPLSVIGRIATLILIIVGVGTLFYTAGSILEFVIEGHFLNILERRRMKGRIEKLKDHYIVCGFGRVGREVAKELSANAAQFVIVEKSEEALKTCPYSYVEGNAVEDEVLMAAGIMGAKGLISALGTDADNVFVTLTARSIRPDLYIVSRASTEESEAKLMKAGADRVISPHAIGGRRMAAMMIKPVVCDYLDIVTHGEGLEFELERVEIGSDSPLANKGIGEVRIRDKTGAMILAVKKRTGEFNTTPSAVTLLEPGDTLLAIGTDRQIKALEDLVR